MNFGTDFVNALLRAAVLAGVATLLCAAIAFASNAISGGSYTGHYSGGSSEGLTFKVSANGKKVFDFSVNTPVKCKGGCGGVGSASGGSATISKQGTFKVVLKIVFPSKPPRTEGTDVVTGTFLKHGKAKGTVSSHFTHGSSSDRTESWTATG